MNCQKVDDQFVKCMLNWWVIENDCFYYYCFLANHSQFCTVCWSWWLVLVHFFIINSPLQFCTMWLVPVMIVNLRSWEQMSSSRWCGGRFFCWSRQTNVITLELFWERIVFCFQHFCSRFLNSFWFGHVNPRFRYM